MGRLVDLRLSQVINDPKLLLLIPVLRRYAESRRWYGVGPIVL